MPPYYEAKGYFKNLELLSSLTYFSYFFLVFFFYCHREVIECSKAIQIIEIIIKIVKKRKIIKIIEKEAAAAAAIAAAEKEEAARKYWNFLPISLIDHK